MKKTALFIALIALLSACHDKVYNKYMACVPVYTDYETFRQPVQFESSRPLTKKGNIYIKDNYLYVIEPDAGIHVIDNTSPSSPNNLGFLKIIGCKGMAIRGNYLYVNSLIDLIIIDISTLSAPVEVARMKDIFPQALPAADGNYPMAPIDKNLGVVTSWKYEKVKEETTSQPVWNNCPTCETFATTTDMSGSNGGQSTGVSGSITKFAVIGDYLYVMENNQLIPINVSNPTSPTKGEATWVWREVETLFAHGTNIFMGTTSGMLIYGTTNPNAPEYISSVNHLTACDPVVVQDNYCYVTIRSGTTCMGELNQLDVIDISDLYNPVLKQSFQLTNPHGLGIDGNNLFICDGSAGLKIFNATDPLTCGNNLIKKFGDIQATDVIPFDNTAIVIGDDGIYQYDYSDINNLTLLSSIKF